MNMNVHRIDSGAKLTEEDLDACIQASWNFRGTSSQPIAAEACTELPAADEYDFPRSDEDLEMRAWFWSFYAALLIVACCAALAHLLPAT